MTDVPVKPLTDNPIDKSIYYYDCEDYVLQNGNDSQLETLIKLLKAELTIRLTSGRRRGHYMDTFGDEQIKFLEYRKTELDKLKAELEEAKMSLRKSYMQKQTKDESDEDVEESEEMPKVRGRPKGKNKKKS